MPEEAFMNRRLRWKIVFVLALTIGGSISAWYPPLADRLGLSGPRFLLRQRLALGLDLKGGVQFELRVNVNDALGAGSQATRDEIVAQAKQAADKRVNALGVVEPLIAVQGRNRDHLLVQLPGFTDVARARAVLGTTARLEWKLVEAGPFATREAVLTNGAEPAGTEVLTRIGKAESDASLAESFYLVRRTAEVTGADIRTARATTDENGQPSVAFSLTSDGGRRFAALTGSNVGRQLAIVLDDHVQSAPVIETPITGGDGTIRGFSWDEASDLALVLRAGALPVSMTFLGGHYVGPTLGAQSIRAGVGASLAGLGLVAAFMLVYYNRAGINAVLAVIANLLVLLGAMTWFGAALTLPGIAGLILTIGMGVDSSVLIFERIKEELKTGRSVRSAVAAGFDRVFLTILDTHIASLIAAAFLFQFGTGPIRGFATTLTLGLLTNVFTAVMVSRTLFEATLSRQRESGLELATFGRSASRRSIDFLSYRTYALWLSTVVVAASLALLAVRDVPLGLDFTGGTAVVARFTAPVNEDDVRRAIPGDATVQRYGAASDRALLIRLAQAPTGADDIDIDAGVTSVKTALAAANLPAVEFDGTEMVGPAIGADLQRKGAYATAASLAGIAAYIGLRFRPSFAAGAIVATIHDIVVTVSLLSLCGYDLTLNVVAGVLTIAGYSVNDTIVVFDRVRENLRSIRHSSIGAAVNTAVNQTLSRTIITAGTTFLAVLALFLFGGEVLEGFAFAMLVGIVTGTYSTIFVAAPVAALLAHRRT
jgi:SecD/SecF fusion protein